MVLYLLLAALVRLVPWTLLCWSTFRPATVRLRRRSAKWKSYTILVSICACDIWPSTTAPQHHSRDLVSMQCVSSWFAYHSNMGVVSTLRGVVCFWPVIVVEMASQLMFLSHQLLLCFLYHGIAFITDFAGANALVAVWAPPVWGARLGKASETRDVGDFDPPVDDVRSEGDWDLSDLTGGSDFPRCCFHSCRLGVASRGMIDC